jgi:hypothetical protein
MLLLQSLLHSALNELLRTLSVQQNMQNGQMHGLHLSCRTSSWCEGSKSHQHHHSLEPLGQHHLLLLLLLILLLHLLASAIVHLPVLHQLLLVPALLKAPCLHLPLLLQRLLLHELLHSRWLLQHN